MWDALDPPDSDDRYAGDRERLRAELRAMRERAAQLAGQIRGDLPELTVHDVEHLDALWPLASRIGGQSLNFTPLETLVFGAAVLIHDLGLAVAAYPGGKSSLRSEPEWSDAVAVELRARLHRSPSRREIENPNGDVEVAAQRRILRMRHAEQAAALGDASWEPRPGVTLHLLSDEIRHDFGHLIGQVAASHWWPTADLPSRLPVKAGPPGRWPHEWVLRPVLVASLLRCADAAHLDSSRAPDWSRVGRELGQLARRHWDFQARLRQPQIVSDRLEFRTIRPFSTAEADAWWMCLDSLRMVDTELREVDALLSDLRLPRLAARSVAGVEAPDRLARFVEIEGWEPVDAQVTVSSVATLVSRLGGSQLYAGAQWVPIRELIQNASDAIRARRTLEPGYSGTVVVRVTAGPEDEPWLEVEDDGVGMEPRVLSGSLLDFGRSLWDSAELSSAFPGLSGSGFQPAGRFGIGFFSAFMWSDHIELTSRALRRPAQDTHVLVFSHGLGKRPLLRRALPHEERPTAGTSVRLRLRSPLSVSLPYRSERLRDINQLVRQCAELAPALPVDLAVEMHGERRYAVRGDDWETISSDTLLARLLPELTVSKWSDDRLKKVGGALGLLRDANGDVIARGTLLELDRVVTGSVGVLVAGGLRVCRLRGLGGIWCATEVNAARATGQLRVRLADLAPWADEQARALSAILSDSAQVQMAELVCGLDGNPEPLKVCRVGGGDASPGEDYLTLAELERWAADRPEVLLVDFERALWQIFDEYDPKYAIADSVVDVRGSALERPHFEHVMIEDEGADLKPEVTVAGRIQSAVARAWGVPDGADLVVDRPEVVVGRTIEGRKIDISFQVTRLRPVDS